MRGGAVEITWGFERARRGARRAAPVALAALLALLGCASDLSSLPVRYVGDLSGLERVRISPWEEVHRRPNVNFGALAGVQVARVAVADDFESYGEVIPERDLERVRRRLELMLAAALEHSFPITRESGSGVLRVEATIVALRPSELLRPPVGTWTARSRREGAAGVQIALRDAKSGALLLAIRDTREDAPLAVGPSTWADADWWFRYWGDELRALLERESDR